MEGDVYIEWDCDGDGVLDLTCQTTSPVLSRAAILSGPGSGGCKMVVSGYLGMDRICSEVWTPGECRVGGP